MEVDVMRSPNCDHLPVVLKTLLIFVLVCTAKNSMAYIESIGNESLIQLDPDRIVSNLLELDVQESEREQPRDNEVADLDLDHLIEFSKKNNIMYQAAQKNIEIARDDLVTAGLLPNPQFFYSQSFIGGVPGSEGGSAEHAPGLTFELDLVGKRGKRKDVAEKGVTIEKLNFLDFDRIFKFQLRQTYREYLLLSEQLKYKREFFSTYLKLMEGSKIRAEKGDISGVEYDRLDLDRIGYEAEYRVTELQLVETSQKMRRLLGIPVSHKILPLKGSLFFVPLSQLGATKRKVAIDRRPDLAALLTKMEQSDAMASLKRREAIPSLTLGGEYRKKGTEGYFGLSVTMPIPVFNRNQGEISKAEDTSKKIQLEISAKRREITSELQNRAREVLIREQMLLKYQDLGLLEKNRTVAEQSRFAYSRKAYSIVALLESQRNYINVQRNYFDQLYLYYTAIDGLFAAAEGT
jgi:cobalt-zinc-cadmium efflux system outer membrane protein